MFKMAPPPHEARISTLFPRGATFNIVGPKQHSGVSAGVSNNIENGTSTTRGSYPPGLTASLPHCPAW